MNILDSLKGLVTDELVSKAANALGEDSGAISNVMQGAIPAVLGGLMGTDSKNHGALSGLFGQAASNDNLMGDVLGGLVGGEKSGGIMDSLISGIFGDKIGGIVNILTNLGGFKNEGSSKSILGIVGSLAASYFGKKMAKDGIGFGSILNLIGKDKDAILDAAPEGLADVMGISRGPWEMVKDVIGDVTGAVTGAAGAAAGTAGKVVEGAGDAFKGAAGAAGKAVDGAGDVIEGAAGAAKSGMKWLWPLLLLAALAIALMYFLKGCNKNAETGAVATEQVHEDATTDNSEAAVDAEMVNASGALDDAGNWIVAKGEAISIKMEDGSEVETTKGSVIDKLYQFVSSPEAVADKNKPENWFNFEDVLFETGSAKLKSSAMPQIKNAARILQSFPDVQIKIGGYTDNTGDATANLKLSDSRAKAVYQAIRNNGAAASSFDEKAYEGYGIEYPVASNETAEGRAQNRRIACVVTKK